MKGANRSWGFGPAAAGRCEGNLCKKRLARVPFQPGGRVVLRTFPPRYDHRSALGTCSDE